MLEQTSTEWLPAEIKTYHSGNVPESSGILVVPALLDGSTCADIITSMRSQRLSDSRIVGEGTESIRDRSIRRSSQTSISAQLTREVCTLLAQRIAQCKEVLHLPVRFASPPVLLKYAKGDFFIPHQDNSGQQNAHMVVSQRLATYVIYLSSRKQAATEPTSFTGGRFIAFSEYNPFIPAEKNPRLFAFSPSAGDLLVFPASMYHAAEPVHDNIRYCLIGWLFEHQIG